MCKSQLKNGLVRGVGLHEEVPAKELSRVPMASSIEHETSHLPAGTIGAVPSWNGICSVVPLLGQRELL